MFIIDQGRWSRAYIWKWAEKPIVCLAPTIVYVGCGRGNSKIIDV